MACTGLAARLTGTPTRCRTNLDAALASTDPVVRALAEAFVKLRPHRGDLLADLALDTLGIAMEHAMWRAARGREVIAQ